MSVKDVVYAIKASNNDIEGRVLEFAGREYMCAAAATSSRLRTSRRFRSAPIHEAPRSEWETWRRYAPALTSAAALPSLDGKGEVVGGIIVMRFGENALKVIDRVKAKLREVQGVPHL
jgi:Cu(I)/Ag(I) efflux system membrane protein CusA/SilA